MRGSGAVGFVVMAVAAAAAVAQQPTSTQSTQSPWNTPTKLPDVKTPDVRVPDYFGPSLSQPFNEKSLFPNATTPPAGGTPTTPGPAGLPPPPGVGPPVFVPDGSLPQPPGKGDPPVFVPGASPPPRRTWHGGFEFGINGSEGNSDVTSLRFGSNVDRKLDRNAFHMDALYTFTRQDGVTKQNQAILNARDEILFPGSPWSIFSATQVEYDEFRAYDLRAGAYSGFSYRWLKTDATLFKTRLGAGATREMDTVAGGSPNRWVPEAVIGDDFNHRFTDRQSFVSSLDVFPNLSQIGQFRVRARAGYEIVIAPEHGMVLRLGVQDRYDSNPGPARRNDLNYFTTLLFRF
ncbi:MAG TPA: DUF481 domain-containing protein [Urbifossiella sp.]|jgi:hypothetical protein|nr:DUF481 domain-containing protein [Urbifossiella sp.]